MVTASLNLYSQQIHSEIATMVESSWMTWGHLGHSFDGSVTTK